MTSLELYNTIWDKFVSITDANNIADRDKYLELRYLRDDSLLKTLYGLTLEAEDGLPFTFAQIIITSVPAKLEGYIDFCDKELVHDLFKEFKPDLFLAHARSLKQAELCEYFMSKLGINSKLKSAINGYILAIRNLSDYLLSLKSRDNLIKDLAKKYNPLSLGSATSYLSGKAGIGTGFTAKISERVLMELDNSFSDIIPYADYLKDVFKHYLGKEFKNRREFSEFVISFCNEVNKDNNITLTPYRLNKLIYVLHTGDFYLDNLKLEKGLSF